LLFSESAIRAEDQIQDRVSFRLRLRRRHQVSEGLSHLDGAKHRGHFRHLGHLHPSGLHTRLEAQRKQIQMPVSRQRLRSRRRQLTYKTTANLSRQALPPAAATEPVTVPAMAAEKLPRWSPPLKQHRRAPSRRSRTPSRLPKRQTFGNRFSASSTTKPRAAAP